MSSFDPPLSRTTAALLVVGAVLVFAWVVVAAYLAPPARADAADAAAAISNVETP